MLVSHTIKITMHNVLIIVTVLLARFQTLVCFISIFLPLFKIKK